MPYLKVQRNQRKHQCLQVLHQVVENAQSLGVRALLHIHQRPDLGGFERNVLVTHPDLELLAPVLVLLRPLGVVLPARTRLVDGRRAGREEGVDVLHNLGVLDDALDLFDQ